MIQSRFTNDPTTQRSWFVYSRDGGAERTLTFDDGHVEIDPVTAPLVMPLPDFQALVTDVGKWIEVVGLMWPLKLANRASIEAETFTIGAKVAGTWSVVSGVTFYGPLDGTMLFTHDPLTGVTIHPRPALNITYANLIWRNQRANEMVTAALTGERPKIGASVVGPRGPQGETGATGATGPEGPPAPYRQRDIGLVWNDVNMNLVGDTALAIPFARWRALEVTAYSPSIDLSTVARFAVYTAPAAGGMALVNPVLVSLNTAENDVYAIVPASKRITQTTPIIYLRCTQAKGTPATCSFQITIRDLTE